MYVNELQCRTRFHNNCPSLLPGNAEAYFRAHTGEQRTSDKTLGHLKTPKLTQEEMDDLLSAHTPRYAAAMEAMREDYRAKFGKWLRLLEEDFSVITFGFGEILRREDILHYIAKPFVVLFGRF